MIDFSTTKPEQVRNVPKKTTPISWDALEYVVRTTTGTQLQKNVFRRQFFKAIRQHGVEAMTPWFRYHYCCARLALGDFSDYWGWEFRGLNNKDEGDAWAAHMFWEETWLPKWAGGNVDRLLVIGEQGIGDVVFYASIIPEAMIRCREVIFECDPRLHDLFERSFPGLICRREMPFEDRRGRYGPIDAFIPAADLMRMFRKSKSHFPGKKFLRPDPKRVEEFEKYRGRTGICWRGRQGKVKPQDYQIENPLSLQYWHTWDGAEQPDLDLFEDIEGIVALCSVLDKVVTPPQSIHHFAGAVGTKVEIVKGESGSGEVEGQIIWDHSTLYNNGKLLWYPDVQVFNSMEDWHEKNHSPEIRRSKIGESPETQEEVST